jgi:vacuolar-type H+-ATPase subunit E/Vma4
MLSAARCSAATAISASSARAASRLDGAHNDAAKILADARADGAATARYATTAIVTTAKRESREAILAAQRRAYEALRQGVREELARLVESSEGVAMLLRLEALARTRLGPNATVERLNDGRVGVRATDGSRNLDVPVDRFVDSELAGLGDRIAALWR